MMIDVIIDEVFVGYKIIKFKCYLEEGDYIFNMVVVGIYNGMK